MKKIRLTNTSADRATAYARDVVSGAIPACRYAVAACKRHLADLERADLTWSAERSERAIGFFRHLHHYKGELAGRAFHLEPWECFVVGSIYGWDNKLGRRRFKTAYIEVPRKNGKTTLSGGVGLLELLREPGSEVYSLATKEDQAKLSWRDASVMIKKSPFITKRIHTRLKEIRFPAGNGIWRPLGRDSKTLDGLNPQCGIIDEFHAHKDRSLIDVIADGMGARQDPLLLIITTAGYDHEGPCWEYRTHASNVLLDPDFTDDRFFGLIYTVEDENSWDDEHQWLLANPNMGVSKSLEYMRGECELAKMMPSRLVAFKNKQLNIWTSAALMWLPMDHWDACDQDGDLDGDCYAGLDLASTRDVAACVWYWPRSGRVLMRAYIPKETVRTHQKMDRVPYALWAEQGHICLTEGNAIDYDFIRNDINAQPFKAKMMAVDRWNSAQIVAQLQQDGHDIVQFGQGYASLSTPSKELERLVVTRAIRHGGNPVLRWMASNTMLEMDAAGNIKPSKKKSVEKIDGIVALIMALGVSLTAPEQPTPGFAFL